ncbi:TIGR03089 family protein [Cellulomonas sp. zg-ZUI222]|uniref:TIGR03089 family protein n=1 Tax=Cellulomonas wangleii TaxID=2816956 RepID=UPI001A93AB5C|nr:TIGR03089 family protein [Cellulomonas wangleii]
MADVTTTLPRVLEQLTRDPGRPRVTWYTDAERVELSGTVLVNWVTKTTNLLVEELDAGPGARVLLDLPAAWRALTWAPAVWRSGACVVLPDGTGTADGGGVDVVVTDRPEAHTTGVPLVAVASPALARSWSGPLPAGALDAAAAVMTYGDTLGWLPATDATAPALVTPTGSTAHAALVEHARTVAGTGSAGSRVLLDVGSTADRGAALAATLTTALAAWSDDGSLVLVGPGLDAQARDRLRRTERVDADATA